MSESGFGPQLPHHSKHYTTLPVEIVFLAPGAHPLRFFLSHWSGCASRWKGGQLKAMTQAELQWTALSQVGYSCWHSASAMMTCLTCAS